MIEVDSGSRDIEIASEPLMHALFKQLVDHIARHIRYPDLSPTVAARVHPSTR